MTKFVDEVIIGNAEYIDYKELIKHTEKVANVVFYKGPEYKELFGTWTETGKEVYKVYVMLSSGRFTVTRSRTFRDNMAVMLMGSENVKVAQSGKESAHIVTTPGLEIEFKYTPVFYADGKEYDTLDFVLKSE